jgi:hypothetical protein
MTQAAAEAAAAAGAARVSTHVLMFTQLDVGQQLTPDCIDALLALARVEDKLKSLPGQLAIAAIPAEPNSESSKAASRKADSCRVLQAEAQPPLTHSNTLPALPAAREGHNAEGAHVVAATHDGHKG